MPALPKFRYPLALSLSDWSAAILHLTFSLSLLLSHVTVVFIVLDVDSISFFVVVSITHAWMLTHLRSDFVCRVMCVYVRACVYVCVMCGRQESATALEKKEYPAFYHRPAVSKIILTHPLFHYLVPANNPSLALLYKELNTNFYSPFTRHSVLLLFLDEHQPTFALPPALPPAAVQHRLTANALLASVAQLFRVALAKKETLFVPTHKIMPIIYVPTLVRII
jgi:hypothetical protein